MRHNIQRNNTKLLKFKIAGNYRHTSVIVDGFLPQTEPFIFHPNENATHQTEITVLSKSNCLDIRRFLFLHEKNPLPAEIK